MKDTAAAKQRSTLQKPPDYSSSSTHRTTKLRQTSGYLKTKRFFCKDAQEEFSNWVATATHWDVGCYTVIETSTHTQLRTQITQRHMQFHESRGNSRQELSLRRGIHSVTQLDPPQEHEICCTKTACDRGIKLTNK